RVYYGIFNFESLDASVLEISNSADYGEGHSKPYEYDDISGFEGTLLNEEMLRGALWQWRLRRERRHGNGSEAGLLQDYRCRSRRGYPGWLYGRRLRRRLRHLGGSIFRNGSRTRNAHCRSVEVHAR